MSRSHALRLLGAGMMSAAGILVYSQFSIARAQLPRLILNEVTADFVSGADHPLVKSKFNVYDPVGPTIRQFDRSVNLLSELNVDTYRIELAWGRRSPGFGTPAGVGGTTDKLTYDFEPLDHMVSELQRQNVQLLGSYSYTPAPLQDPGVQRYRDSTPPKSVEKWKEVITAFARHHRDRGLPFGIHEIWNEPDGLYQFYAGKETEYHQLFIAAVEAIRSVDPDAVTAGPASAPELVWHRSFPEFIAKNNLPLDYFTFHHYGSAELAMRDIDKVVASLNRFPQLNTAAMSLDEWHDADCCSWCKDDVRHRFEGASQLLHDFKLLLARPELASVSWAWFLDPDRATGCMGLVTSDGRRKAVFNAWKIYAMMPVDRKKVIVNGPLEAMASSDDHKAAVVVWNRDPYDRRVDVNLKNVPFAKGNIRIYRIDKLHASYVDGADEMLAPVETFMNVDTANWSWIGAVPRGGTAYFEVEDGTGLSELAPAKVAKVIRVNRYYPARGVTSSYADFDRKTWIARLGAGTDARADQEIGVLAADLPDNLDLAVKLEGELKKQDANSLFGIRVDYMVNGQYAKALLFHGPYNGVDLYDPARTAVMLWGLKNRTDQPVRVPDLSKFRIALKQNAPAGWAGKAHIAFILQNSGAGTRAHIVVRPGS